MAKKFNVKYIHTTWMGKNPPQFLYIFRLKTGGFIGMHEILMPPGNNNDMFNVGNCFLIRGRFIARRRVIDPKSVHRILYEFTSVESIKFIGQGTDMLTDVNSDFLSRICKMYWD